MSWRHVAINIKHKDYFIDYLKLKTKYIDDCWLYTGGSQTKDGYRRLVIGGQVIGVHRLSAFLYLGLDLSNLQLQANHKRECTHKTCWNPDHLYVGTHKENLADAKALGQFRNSGKTHCLNGHRFNRIHNGKRSCNICQAERQRKLRAKAKAKVV